MDRKKASIIPIRAGKYFGFLPRCIWASGYRLLFTQTSWWNEILFNWGFEKSNAERYYSNPEILQKYYVKLQKVDKW